MKEAADLAAAVAAAAVAPRFSNASDEELLADLDAVEQLGRLVDGLRITAAAQAEHRSRRFLGEASLAFRSGARDGVELVQQVARIGHAEAGQRVGPGSAIAPRLGLLSDELPGQLPALADAVAAGLIGVESARVIVNTWKHIRSRVEDEPLADMVESLIGYARVETPEAVREVAKTWALAIDPDGAEPKLRKRALRIGRTLEDGTTKLTMILTSEDLAMLKELLQSRRRNAKLVRAEPGSDATGEGLNPEWQEEHGPDCGDESDPELHDPRTRSQQDYDTATEAWALATRAEAEGIGGTAVTHETVITVTADEVERREGQGWAPGIMAGLPLPVIERKACTGHVRLEVVGPKGEALYFSRKQRTFSAARKVPLVGASGGTCEFPGCRVPHPYLEAHHVRWWMRDAGDTSIDNGMMLCSHHHRLVHAKDSPIEIRPWNGDLRIVPARWSGVPYEAHRRRSGPLRQIDIRLLRRARDLGPWAG